MSTKPLVLSILTMLVLALLTACGGGGNQAARPTAPGNVTATPGEGRIILTWEDRSDDETEFVIYREVVRENLSVQALSPLTTVPANTETYADTAVVATTSYRYAVAARNAAGESPRIETSEPVQPAPDAGTARLTLTQVGGGQGVVTSIPAGIECVQRVGVSSDCTEDYPDGTNVTLSAQPDPGSLFAGWGGACSGTGACSVNMNASLEVSATFVRERSTLSVRKSGNGTGTVLDVNSGGDFINCGSTCTTDLRVGQDLLVLEPQPGEGSLFAGWENCPDTRTNDRCWVMLEDDLSLSARFSQPSLTIVSFTASPSSAQPGSQVTLRWEVRGDDPYTLTLVNNLSGAEQDVTGQTSASVTVQESLSYTLVARSFAEEKSRNATISVGDAPVVTRFAVSRASVTAGQQVTLEWEVAGADPITVTISGVPGTFGPSGSVTVTPSAPATTYVLTATSPFGTVSTTPTSTPPSRTVTVGVAPSITAFTANGASSTTITLGQSATLSWTVTGSTPITLTLDDDSSAPPRTVTGSSTTVSPTRTTTYELSATNAFGTAQPRFVTVTVQAPLTVAKTGQGTGTVTSDPAGINCGTGCTTETRAFPAQELVTLTATPAADSELTGWSIPSCIGATSCQVTMDDPKTVTVNFRPKPLLTVRVTGNGTVTGTGISCDPDCTERYNTGTTVNLTANLNNGFNVAWTGCDQVDRTTCTVTMNESKTVSAAFTQTPAVNSVTVTPESATVNVGETEQLQATVSTVGGASESVTWTSSDTDVATVNASGLVTGVGTGTATITATSNADSSKSDTATVTVEPNLVPLNLTISGNGQVSFSPAATTCTTTCTRDFAQGTSVTLTATHASDSNFAGWSGEGCTGTGTCTFTMSQARNVTATFTLKPAVNSVTVTPDSATINVGETQQLQATVSTVGGASEAVTWTSSDDYVATVNASGLVTGVGVGTATITATSTADPSKSDTASVTVLVPVRTLDVAFTGSGAGTVNFSPSGDPCTADCTRSFQHNTSVMLTATPSIGSDFTGWSGACSGSACTLTMDGDKSVSASFTLQSFSLSVSRTGDGTGTVTSADGGISCGEDCAESYPYNASVTLEAQADGSSAFAGWDGDCFGTNCQLSMTGNKSVQAEFFVMVPEPPPGDGMTGVRSGMR